MKYSVAVLVGSARTGSYNRRLAEVAMAQAPESLEMKILDITTLPIYSQDLDDPLPAEVVAFKDAIARAGAVLFVTPEHNRSIPALMKNAVDWGSRPDGQNFWKKKPAGVMGASDGQFGTINAQFDLRKVLMHVSCLVMPQPQVLVTNCPDKVDGDGYDEKTTKVVRRFMLAWEEWIKYMKDFGEQK